MFALYKKHNNKLYNKLVELSRNKFFYHQVKLPDDFETRILLIFFHLVTILKISKNSKEKSQEIFDNIFLNIEYHIRESGYGDVAVNKKMKTLNKIFFDILVNFNIEKKRINIINKYFLTNHSDNNENPNELAKYFSKFENFCFALDVDNMLNGSINFNFE